MRLRFLGAARTVTGSCHLLEANNLRVMVDCGLFQGPRSIRERNYDDFPVPPENIDYVLLTHAHIDHSGLIPKLINNGFKGKIITTECTTNLCRIMLPDSGYIHEMEVERLNRKNLRAGRPLVEPIYTAEDAFQSLNYFESVNYGEIINLAKGFKVRFLDAGHILGSAIVEVWVEECNQQIKAVFTGDLGMVNKPYIKDPSIIKEADYLIMESTYGDRVHQDKGNHLELLHEIIWSTYHKGGNLIIPAFAVERTQDLLYSMNQLVKEKRFPPMKIYIDSPMATDVTDLFRNCCHYFDEETCNLISQGNNPLDMPNLVFTRTVEDSMALNKVKGGAVIISASGMCDAGRIKHHLKHNLWRPDSTVLFVGYQAPGTKGRRIKDGIKKIRIHGEEIMVRADIKSIDGYSSHADQRALLDWIGHIEKGPAKIFLVHGEQHASEALAEKIREQYKIPVYIPFWREIVRLTPGILISSDDLRKMFGKITGKMEKLLGDSDEHGKYAGVMRHLRDLDRVIELPDDKK